MPPARRSASTTATLSASGLTTIATWFSSGTGLPSWLFSVFVRLQRLRGGEGLELSARRALQLDAAANQAIELVVVRRLRDAEKGAGIGAQGAGRGVVDAGQQNDGRTAA